VEGSVVGGDLTIGGRGTFVGRDYTVSQTSAGAHQSEFQVVYDQIAERPDTTPAQKDDIKAEVEDIEIEVKKGDAVDESFLARRLRSLERMAPDILDVVLATLSNPAAGLGMVAAKVAARIRQQAPQADSAAG
jgi:hypothetical protein